MSFYYSTNHTASRATLRDAVVRGLAEDRGLYMPEVIKQLPATFWQEIADLTFQEVACRVADAFFGEDVPAEDLRRIVCDTLSFDTPLVHVEDNIYALELFHGPTLAFKDVGARFMARLLQYFIRQNPTTSPDGQRGGSLNVLVATSGDTGSAVANGFLGVDGIHVYVLYPKGKVSPIQECQFTTLGQNITALEVDGVFDDCQRLVKSAFMDADLNAHMRLTSANSINVARFLPQAFYYFWAYAQILKLSHPAPSRKAQQAAPASSPAFLFSSPSACRFGAARIRADIPLAPSSPSAAAPASSPASLSSSPSACRLGAARIRADIPLAPSSPSSDLKLVFCVPSGNFGNICSALFGHVMGLPVHRFIAANNANDVFYQYLQTGTYTPRPSIQTIANAMDVGDPSNFARILDLYSRPDVQSVLKSRDIAQPLPSPAGQIEAAPSSPFLSATTYTDAQIAATMRDCYVRTGYVLDPHGACGYRALKEHLLPDEIGVFLETAHPAKFKDTVDTILGIDLPVPGKLQAFMRGRKQSIPLSADFADFKAFLLAE